MLAACARQPLSAGNRPESGCQSPLIFKAATFYAGATDYFFTAEDRTSRVFRIESEDIEPGGFGVLTVPGEQSPPETNPVKIGRSFAVCEGEGGRLVLRRSGDPAPTTPPPP